MSADTPAPGPGHPGTLRLALPADPWSVRSALQRLLTELPAARSNAELAHAVEIVLSEVLNNIVEHAYQGRNGPIDVALWPDPRGGLGCMISDHGRAMPGEKMPSGELPPTTADSLPEGGFGWHLIHALTCDIRYDRQRDTNRLSFRIPAQPAPLPAGATDSPRGPHRNGPGATAASPAATRPGPAKRARRPLASRKPPPFE